MTTWNECFCVTAPLLATQITEDKTIPTEDGGWVVAHVGDWLVYRETDDGKPDKTDMPLILTDEQYCAQFIETEGNLLIRHLPDLVHLMVRQLRSDYERWGDTWRKRPVEGQEVRAFERYRAYWDQWRARTESGGMPWMKVIGEAWICVLRVISPEVMLESENVFEGLE